MTWDQLHRASSAYRAAMWWRHYANQSGDIEQRRTLRRGARQFMRDARLALLAAHDRPMAAAGLHSYRYRGRYGWVMIGALNEPEALKSAARSIAPDAPTVDRLQVWTGRRYAPALTKAA